MERKKRRLEYRDLKPAIKEKFKEYLDQKLMREGLSLPADFEGRLAFGAYMKPGVDEKFRFNLMVPGQRPEDAILILEAYVSRIDGRVRCRGRDRAVDLCGVAGG